MPFSVLLRLLCFVFHSHLKLHCELPGTFEILYCKAYNFCRVNFFAYFADPRNRQKLLPAKYFPIFNQESFKIIALAQWWPKGPFGFSIKRMTRPNGVSRDIMLKCLRITSMSANYAQQIGQCVEHNSLHCKTHKYSTSKYLTIVP